MIFHRSLSKDLAEILLDISTRSLHDLVQVLVRGSGRDPGEIVQETLA